MWVSHEVQSSVLYVCCVFHHCRLLEKLEWSRKWCQATSWWWCLAVDDRGSSTGRLVLRCCTVYRVILPCVIFALLWLQTVSPHLELAQTMLCLIKDRELRLWNSPSLKFAFWQRGRIRTKIKRGEYFPAYSITNISVVEFMGRKWKSMQNSVEWFH